MHYFLDLRLQFDSKVVEACEDATEEQLVAVKIAVGDEILSDCLVVVEEVVQTYDEHHVRGFGQGFHYKVRAGVCGVVSLTFLPTMEPAAY